MLRTNGTDMRLGILGGGQLGKMLCLAAGNWSLETLILDPSGDCPAAGVCSEFMRGDFAAAGDVVKFGRNAGMLTIEIEHVNADALAALEREGIATNPSPGIISLIQDKGAQKRFYGERGIPAPDFETFDTPEEIKNAVSRGAVKIPFVQKLRRSGYDGRGVRIVRTEADLGRLLEGPSLAEGLVDIRKELSVIVARNRGGETACFPPVEMIFNDEANLVEYLVCPAPDVDAGVLKECEAVALELADALGLCGIMAVEIFLSSDGAVLVNEAAPRPHNSGHHTIESCATSQYEQCLRAVLGLPLGETSLKTPSVMVNILGEEGHEGEARYAGLAECMKVGGASFHIYGKRVTKPFRKMGHVTVADSDIKSAFEKARFIKQNLRVVS